ncbi:acyltransferase family protein [Puniceicoccales bacterium CK1056]|uniref:Acyltransferase family protein n=1 Tax=Oceanipulchritudo coccoides TaxID=2706888 RepID=A0A6B2M4Z0_9BACT|nr:acyltransferase family protein [Oceanipulchritudo coccoides]NDV63426.1 acyltransferase family protein [Oceanipulchritudo coccoides]
MQTTQELPQTERFHSLDALRGFALLLGVFFHAAESFCPERLSWAVLDKNTHWIADWFQFLSHSFRMELFFLIAGFFAHLVYHRAGARHFILNRLSRIFLPFMMGWLILFPVLSWIWISGFAQAGRLSDMGIPEEFHSMPAWKLTIGALMQKDFWIENFSLMHLWFLHQLLVIYGVILVARALVSSTAGRSFNHRLRRAADNGFAMLFNARFGWLVLVVVTVPILWTMNEWTVDTPNESLIPHLPTTLLYGLFFLVGWMLHRNTGLLGKLKCASSGFFLVGLGIGLSFLVYFLNDALVLLGLVSLKGELYKHVYQLAYVTMMWAFVIGTITLFQRFAQTRSAFWKYIADASYWIYLVHLVVVVPVQIAIAEQPWPAALKYFIILAVSLPILFASYHLFVRSTIIGKWLNGKKHASPKRQPLKPVPNFN